MLDFQMRVINERNELADKVSKLILFIASDKFLEVPQNEKERLKAQLASMIPYLFILVDRISWFDPPELQ